MESSKEMTNRSLLIDHFDAYDWYLKLGPLSNVDEKYLHYKLPTWNDFVNHPDYDAFWKRQGFAPWLNRVTVPTLNVAGWWDQEDFYGPLKIYELLERHDTAHQNFLVVGPWNHGGWSRGDGQKLGRIEFAARRPPIIAMTFWRLFWRYHLKGKGKLDLPEALTFRTGTNQWVRNDAWPPKTGVAETASLFAREWQAVFRSSLRGRSLNPPTVMFQIRRIRCPTVRGRLMLQAAGQPGWWRISVLSIIVRMFFPGPAKRWPAISLVSGKVAAHLFASTSGTDSDWIVKLIDVYPEKNDANAPQDPKMSGFQLMIAGDVLRGPVPEWL